MSKPDIRLVFLRLVRSKGLYNVTRTDVEKATGEAFPHNFHTIKSLRDYTVRTNPSLGPIKPDWQVRDEQIITAAKSLARIHGAKGVTRQMIADYLDIAPGTVSNYGSEFPSVRRDPQVMKTIRSTIQMAMADCV